jgi:GAF domain-containing protein
MLQAGQDRSGAVWLPAGSIDWTDEIPHWTPPRPAHLVPDAWDAEDMLFLPLRDSDGEVMAIVSVDEPVGGRRPADAELTLLMAFADHAALALEQAGGVERLEPALDRAD